MNIRANSVLLFIVALAVTGILAYFLGEREAMRRVENEQPKLKTLDVTVLQNRLDKISELSTVQFSYTDVATHVKSEKLGGFKIPFSTSTIIIRYGGTIKAGVDLHNARIEVADTTVFFHLPQPVILSHSVDPSSIKILNQSNGLFSSIKITDFQAFCAAHKDSIESVAISSGLLSRAADNAADGLELLAAPLRDMGYHVEISFGESNKGASAGDYYGEPMPELRSEVD